MVELLIKIKVVITTNKNNFGSLVSKIRHFIVENFNLFAKINIRFINLITIIKYHFFNK
jgi:hypothetical protein